MLRVTEMANGEAAKAYYTAALERADYYAEGQEVVGIWGGAAAARLGLKDRPVNREDFGRLVDNRDPRDPGQSLTPRNDKDRRAGYDLTWAGPKGLSVLAALAGDRRIYAVFQRAVRDTMDEMERSMQVRVRSSQMADADRTSGNWIYGEFLHLTARPTDDSVPDPQLHVHCCTMNASFDVAEDRWKAGQFGGIKRDANYYEAAFHARLAREIMALGYQIKARGKYWDLADVPDSVIDKFSKRTNLIEETARQRGIIDAAVKDRLGAETRGGKRRGLTTEDLKAAWTSQLTMVELSALTEARLRAHSSQVEVTSHTQAAFAVASMDFAVEHVFERQSVISDKVLAEAALRRGVSHGVDVDEVWNELKKRCSSGQVLRRQVADQQLCTTREAYEETSRCIEYAREGMGSCRGLAPLWQIHRPELLAPGAADQRAAIMHVLASTDRVVAIRGRAGTGKTFASQEIAAALAQAGHRMQALAPTSEAVNVLRKDGFGTADTVSQLFVNPALQEQVTGGVLLVDEAGLLSSRQLDQLFQIAAARSCRVLLQYDLSQHRSVERGSPVRDLERYAGLSAANIQVVRRQKREDYKAAVTDLSQGEIESAFERLADMGAFVESSDQEQRQRQLASDYLEATKRPDKTALVVSPTHREGDAVTTAIRVALRKSGQLGDDERTIATLRRLGLTAAQRGEAANYKPGQVVQFTQNVKGHERGERLTVLAIDADGKVLVQRSERESTKEEKRSFVLPLHEKAAFDLYGEKPIGLCIGDRIRITQNGYVPMTTAKGSPSGASERAPATPSRSGRAPRKLAKQRLTNGAFYEIVRFEKNGDLVLNNGWVLPKDYGHLAHGYCTTSHASQGKTVDTVLISQSSASFGASSKQQFYVSCTRGKTGIKIYTDSVDELFEAVARSDQQTSAADLMRPEVHPERFSERLKLRRRKSKSTHQKKVLQRAIKRVRQGREKLSISVERGTQVIASPDETRLTIGMEAAAPVIITRNETMLKRTAIYRGESVCVPFISDTAESIHASANKMPATSKTTVSDSAVATPQPLAKARLTMLSSETEPGNQNISI